MPARNFFLYLLLAITCCTTAKNANVGTQSKKVKVKDDWSGKFLNPDLPVQMLIHSDVLSDSIRLTVKSELEKHGITCLEEHKSTPETQKVFTDAIKEAAKNPFAQKETMYNAITNSRPTIQMLRIRCSFQTEVRPYAVSGVSYRIFFFPNASKQTSEMSFGLSRDNLSLQQAMSELVDSLVRK